jgi:hypothetical protein
LNAVTLFSGPQVPAQWRAVRHRDTLVVEISQQFSALESLQRACPRPYLFAGITFEQFESA